MELEKATVQQLIDALSERARQWQLFEWVPDASPEKAAPTVCLSGIASNEPCQPDDTLRRCMICGFVIDTKYSAEPPNPERGPRK